MAINHLPAAAPPEGAAPTTPRLPPIWGLPAADGGWLWGHFEQRGGL